MCAPETTKPYLRLPPWLRVKIPCNRTYSATRDLIRDLDLHTVCQSAKCPNMFECFSGHTATFLIMGDTCTRNCAFCNIESGELAPLSPDEPARVAEAAARLGLRHVVVTSVTRDDLDDGGASHFAEVVRAIRGRLPRASVEVLIPDFQGDEAALNVVLEAKPDVINHNVETPPAYYAEVRPQANYAQSLELLKRVRRAGSVAKSGLMVGLGETDEEVHGVIDDLAEAGCDIVTIGQYMRPSLAHPAVDRYVPPEVFESYERYGEGRGVRYMYAAPLVRSSYNASQFVGADREGA